MRTIPNYFGIFLSLIKPLGTATNQKKFGCMTNPSGLTSTFDVIYGVRYSCKFLEQ